MTEQLEARLRAINLDDDHDLYVNAPIITEAADTLKRYREALTLIGDAQPCHCGRCTFMGQQARQALSNS